MSKNGISYFLREVIFESGACSEDGAALRMHSICGIATSPAFSRIGPSIVFWMQPRGGPILFSLRFILRIYSLFTKAYVPGVLSWLLVSALDKGLRSLGPFVAAGERIG